MELNKKVADFTLQTDEDKTVSLSDDMHGSIHCQTMAYPPMPEAETARGRPPTILAPRSAPRPCPHCG